ncbi:hypothetical protein H7J06_15595 [Mycobacterium hodleri]|uniref:hypothetical protein n=1 Tax=Mycolicibacterium hodleri TaxID=49897 RepID=UPI0021F306E4|nr:hypothetical protein [Mycolicibacterium hodleri]MCV7134412.1 hypothetical protein [Mycolicibacterium hodleri]
MDSLYPMQKVSTWARSYLRAAVEHLGFWADIVAPYEFEPGAVRNVAFRPYLLLGRAGLEAAAHGLWLLTSESDDECISRHVRLMHRDFNLHRTALRAGGEDYSLVDELISDLEIRAAGLSPAPNPKELPPSYAALVRHAAKHCGGDENRWAYFWNAASGAAHGQNWFSLEGYALTFKEEYEPGHFRVITSPEPEFVTATIGAAADALQEATYRWIAHAGYDVALMEQATREVFERMPKKDVGPSVL